MLHHYKPEMTEFFNFRLFRSLKTLAHFLKRILCLPDDSINAGHDVFKRRASRKYAGNAQLV
jgi:hypothetical protein